MSPSPKQDPEFIESIVFEIADDIRSLPQLQFSVIADVMRQERSRTQHARP